MKNSGFECQSLRISPLPTQIGREQEHPKLHSRSTRSSHLGLWWEHLAHLLLPRASSSLNHGHLWKTRDCSHTVCHSATSLPSQCLSLPQGGGHNFQEHVWVLSGTPINKSNPQPAPQHFYFPKRSHPGTRLCNNRSRNRSKKPPDPFPRKPSLSLCHQGWVAQSLPL